MLWAVLCLGSVTWAQSSPIQLILDPAAVGFQGIVRPGSWTPMRITIDNTAGSTRQVIVSWELQDMDKDQLFAQRKTTLTAGRIQNLWLYAVPPLQTKSSDIWWVSVRDQLTGQTLASGSLPILTLAPLTTTLIGTTGSRARLGLEPYTDKIGDRDNVPYTQHESIHEIRGMSPDLLPDRWYGLSALNMLVWTPDSLDPGSPSISAQSLIALRQWVKQGGHLVVSLPAVGELWTSSPLAGLLPQVNMRLVQDQLPPPSLGLLVRPIKIDMLALEPQSDVSKSEVAVLAYDAREQFPVIVTQQRGFGRVTLIGIDLSNRELGSLPNGPRLWRTIARWQGPGLRKDRLRTLLEQKKIASLFNRRAVNIGDLVGPQVAMKGTYNMALLIAMLLFASYWLISGPVSFFVLKHKSRERYAWRVFVLGVFFFTAVSWAFALAFRPVATRVEHFSVLDIDATQQEVRSSSWLSLFVAKHDRIKVQIKDNPSSTSNQHLISSPGFPPFEQSTGFLDPQRYHFASNAPGQMQIPFRATAKQLALNWHGTFADPMPQGYEADRLIYGKIEIENNFPTGTLNHQLPAPLSAVLLIYCPGGGKTPLVWREANDWKPGTPLQISSQTIKTIDRLVAQPLRSAGDDWSGYLWDLQHGNKTLDRLLNADNPNLRLASNEIRTGVEMLSFYDMLPPPAYWKMDTGIGDKFPMHYMRSLGRELDWSKLTVFPRLILIGYMENAPLPIPLHVEDKPVQSTGRVAVRWITHLQMPSAATQKASDPDDLSNLKLYPAGMILTASKTLWRPKMSRRVLK